MSSERVGYVVTELQDDFFVELADTFPVVWPELRSISLKDYGMDSPLTHGLLHLIGTRNIVNEDNVANAERPCKIVHVDMDSPPVSPWMCSTIENIVSLK